jgi:hypothetical protein
MCPLAIPADWKCERERIRVGIAGMFREVGEEFHLHGSEQDLGSPEGEAGLQNAVRCQSHGRDVVEEHALWHEKAATVIWRLAGPRGIGVGTAKESITACISEGMPGIRDAEADEREAIGRDESPAISSPL